MSTDANVREAIRRRHLVWGWQAVPARKYALLVASYYAHANLFVDHLDGPHPRVDHFGRRLIAWIGDYFDPLATDVERNAVLQCVEAATVAADYGPRNPLHAYVDWPPDERDFAAHDLRLTLTDPKGVAGRLVEASTGHATPDSALIHEIMDCLWPAKWVRAAATCTPLEAVEWARRIHREGAFGELPILADRLEDAGCSDRPLLDHCRNHQRHHRGCAALDRILRIEQCPSRGGQATAGPYIRLVGLSAELEGREWSFDSSFEIGRSSAVQLALQVQGTELVSRRHAAVCREEGEWWLADLGSTHGTWLNGVRIGAQNNAPLQAGDILMFADTALRAIVVE